MILGAKDESGPVLDSYGRKVNQTFKQASQDAQEAARGTSLLDAATGGLVNTFKLAGAAIGLYGGFQLADLAKNAVVLAARYETLGATLNNLGKNAGYSASFLEAQEASLRKTGISALGARDSLARMMQANLDLSKASQLARVAQDAAAVAGINSTEAYQHLVYGIQSAQVEMLRTVGLNVSFEQSYAAVAAQTGRTADSLSEAEKAQIRLNAVLEAGKNIAGTYEAAMGTAGKQMLSFARYWEDMQVELGKAFGPALSAFVSNASQGIASLTKAIQESASSGLLHDLGDSLQWIAEHSAVVNTGLTGTVAVLAAVKAEAWLLGGGLSRLALTLEGVGGALTALRVGMVAHPLLTAVAGVAALATGFAYLSDRMGWTWEAMRRQAETANQASQEYAKLADVINGTGGPIREYQAAIAKASGNEAKQLEAINSLRAVFPELVGDYNSVAQAIANVNANMERFLALKRAEAARAQEAADKEQGELLDKLASKYQDLEKGYARYLASISAQIYHNTAYGKGQPTEVDKRYADNLRDLYIEMSKVATAKGISPEMRDSASELAGKVSKAIEKVVGLKEAMRLLGLEAQKVVAPLAAAFTLPKLSKADSEAVQEIVKLQNESRKLAMTPVRAKLFDIDEEEAKKLAGIWDQALRADNPVSASVTDVALKTVTAWGDAQRAALGPEIAKTRTEMVRGMYDLGQASRVQVLANLTAEAAVYAAGGERTRQQYLATEKAITDLKLQGVHERQAITEANISLGREGQGALVAAYQAELNLLPLLKLSSEERAKRELELILKIRDAERSRIDTLQEIETLEVSWMEEGAAKEEASLEASLKRERRALDQKITDSAEYQAKAQSLQAQFDAYADRQRDKQALKEKQNGLEIAAQTARLAGDTRRAKELELEKYILSLKNSNYTQLEQEQLIANKRVEIHQTGLDRMLLEQADFYEGWDKIGENAISGIQSDLVTNFKNTLQGIEGFWAATWESMQDVAFQAFAAIAARLATYGLSNLILAVMPGLGGALGPLAGGTDAVGSALSLASLGSSAVNAYKWFANGGLSTLGTFGTYGGLGSSMFTWGPGAMGATAGGWEAATPMVANGLSGLGYTVTGIGGALTGWQLAQMLYGSGTGSQIGGALGGAGGGIGGAMLGAALMTSMPGVGLVLGGLLGGLGGGALGGGLGSLFDSEDKRLDYEIPGMYAAHYEELSSRVKDYTKALKDGAISQEKFLDEVGKMAPLATGSGDYLAGYGGIIGGTIEKLSGLSAGTEEYARVVREELNPAWIISKGLADDLANGMSELDARKKALSNSIDALAASSGLDEAQQSQLIDLIISQSGSVADLTAKYERYNEIKAQLANAHAMERSQVEALAAELRGLHDELGIQDDPMTNLTEVAGDLNETLSGLDATLRSIMGLPDSKTIDITVNEKHNKDTYHTGGQVRAPLASNLITRHHGGEVPLYAHTGLGLSWPAPQPGEVDIRALVGEWVINRQAVDYYGQDFMAAVNAMRVPVVRASQAARQVAAPAATGQSGQRRTVPIVNISFAGATFGSDPNQVASAVDRRMRATLADMNERGEWPGNSNSMEANWNS